jgi:excisionase family DNA binding protein
MDNDARRNEVHPANPQQVVPEWLRYSEAERYSGLGRSTLTKLVGSGEVKAAKIGKSVRINRSSLEAYMEQQVAGGTSTNGDNDLHTERR